MQDWQDQPQIKDHVLCIGCGYDLHNLQMCGMCPECGVAIERSALGDRLAAADPQWLATIHRGQRLATIGLRACLWAIVGYIIAGVAMLLTFVVLSNIIPSVVGGNAALDAGFWIVFLALGLTAFVGVIIAAIGALLITTRDPRLTLSESPTSARFIAQWSMLALVLSMTAFAAVELLWPGNSAPTLAAAVCALGGFTTVLLCASLRHLAGLLARTAQGNLSVECLKMERQARWLLPLTVLMFLPNLARTGPPTRWQSAATCAALLLFFALIAFCAALNGVMRRASREFSECLERARALDGVVSKK